MKRAAPDPDTVPDPSVHPVGTSLVKEKEKVYTRVYLFNDPHDENTIDNVIIIKSPTLEASTEICTILLSVTNCYVELAGTSEGWASILLSAVGGYNTDAEAIIETADDFDLFAKLERLQKLIDKKHMTRTSIQANLLRNLENLGIYAVGDQVDDCRHRLDLIEDAIAQREAEEEEEEEEEESDEDDNDDAVDRQPPLSVKDAVKP
jgi:hypothetical protein